MAQRSAVQLVAAAAADGQAALLGHLVANWPVKRAWLPLTTRISSAAASTPITAPTYSSPPITLISYNLLAQCLIRRATFPYCAKQTLRISHRRQQLTAELLSYDADILALQEVDCDLYEQHYSVVLSEHGYEGRFGCGAGKNHGCALFFKRAVFDVCDYQLVQYADMASEYTDESTQHEMNRANVALILALRLKQQQPDAPPTSAALPPGVVVATSHLWWRPTDRWVKLRQAERMLSRTHALASQHNLPALLAGDFNLTPATHIYSWLTTRRLEEMYWYKYAAPVKISKDTEETGGSKPEDEQCDEAEEKRVIEQHAQERYQQRRSDMQRLLDRSLALPLVTSAYSTYTSLVPPLPPQPFCDWTGEQQFTNFCGWKGTLDFVFVMHDSERQRSEGGVAVDVESVLEMPALEVVASETALPNKTLGSDHIAIGCQFRLVYR